MTDKPAPSDEILLREAADWMIRTNDTPGDARVTCERDAWRALSAQHEKVWQATLRMWDIAGEVGPAPDNRAAHASSYSRSAEQASSRRRDRLPAWCKNRRVGVTAAATGIAAAVAAFLVSPLPIMLQADHYSATGERRTVELDDGSQVVLDSGSAITVDYGKSERRVKLLAGRAWFDVAHNSARPFAVAASDIRVTVTGTAFDVDLESDVVDVALKRGSVRVSWPSTGGEDGQNMVPGDRLRVSRGGHSVDASRIPASSVASWRRGHLLADGITVADAVRQLDRYYSGRIVVTSDALARSRVTGVYGVDDPARSLKLIVKPHGGYVRQITPWLLLVSKD